MLSTINPLAERSRGNRFGVTAGFFAAGSILGGASLGTLAAVLAALLALLRPPATLVMALVVTCAAIGALIDAGLLLKLPVLRRQLNERWLDRYRGWVYGGWFGWQVGFGFATYVMTTAVGLLVVLGALSQSTVTAVLLGAVFGAVRGSAVFVTRRAVEPGELRRLLRGFEERRQGVLVAALSVQAGVAITAAGLIAPALAGIVAVGICGALLVRPASRRLLRRPGRAVVGPERS
jgi:hypothetical protein